MSTNIGPYMDVMTVRPTQAAYTDSSHLSSKSDLSSSSSSSSTSFSTSTYHQSLFIGPVVLPDMRESYASLAPPMNTKVLIHLCCSYGFTDTPFTLRYHRNRVCSTQLEIKV